MRSDPARRRSEPRLHETARRPEVMRAVERGSHVSTAAIADRARAELGAVPRRAVDDARAVSPAKRRIRRSPRAHFAARVQVAHHRKLVRTFSAIVDIESPADKTLCWPAAADCGYLVDQVGVFYSDSRSAPRAAVPPKTDDRVVRDAALQSL